MFINSNFKKDPVFVELELETVIDVLLFSLSLSLPLSFFCDKWFATNKVSKEQIISIKFRRLSLILNYVANDFQQI